MGRSWLTGASLVLLACASHEQESASSASADAAVPAPEASLKVVDAKPADTGADVREASLDVHVEPPPAPKHYRLVVHTGDSMVGGGLCKALAPKFKAEGTKFIRDVWESASITKFDESDRIPSLMKKYDPDLVLLTLGANDVFNDRPEYEVKHIESIVKKIGHRDCIWIGPPLWKGDKGLVETIREHAAPCRFYDSQHLVLSRAGDGIHPTEKGGEVWADAFWPFFKGEVDAGP
jgi:lysophospholipase L1-like esterase